VRLYESLDRFLLPLANRVVCLSATQASAVARRTSLKRKIRVVMNAVDRRTVTAQDRSCARRMLRARLNLPMDCVIVATAGRLSPEKGTSCFIESLPIIRSRFPEAQFVLFGDGRLREQLVRLADHLGLSSALRFVGHTPDFVELLPGIDILASPSLSEVMPNVILEAMAAAVPVVATDVGSVREIAGNDKALVLIPPSDPTALARAITDMLSDPITAQAAGREGQMRVREAFSPEQQRAQLRALYGEMIPGVTWGQPFEMAESCSPFFAHPEGYSGFLSGRRNARDPG
jgi:glycosyltransferase involved in cell wall biosynthesis